MGRSNLSVKLDCQFLEHNKCSITAKIVPKSGKPDYEARSTNCITEMKNNHIQCIS